MPWDEEDDECRKWGEDQYIEPRPELDDLLRTMSMLMGFDHDERPTCETDMCYTLNFLGLVEHKYECEFDSYKATPELIRLAQRSKNLKKALKDWDKTSGLMKYGFPKLLAYS